MSPAVRLTTRTRVKIGEDPARGLSYWLDLQDGLVYERAGSEWDPERFCRPDQWRVYRPHLPWSVAAETGLEPMVQGLEVKAFQVPEPPLAVARPPAADPLQRLP